MSRVDELAAEYGDKYCKERNELWWMRTTDFKAGYAAKESENYDRKCRDTQTNCRNTSEPNSGPYQPEFDEAAAEKESEIFDDKESRYAFMLGADWQFERDKSKLAEAEKDHKLIMESVERQRDLNDRQSAKLDRAREALKKYGQHLDSCCCRIGHQNYENQCDCGLDEALKEIT